MFAPLLAVGVDHGLLISKQVVLGAIASSISGWFFRHRWPIHFPHSRLSEHIFADAAMVPGAVRVGAQVIVLIDVVNFRGLGNIFSAL